MKRRDRDFDDEPTSRLEQWLAVKAFGVLLLFLAAVAVLLGFWLLVRYAVQPEPYQDPEMRGALEAA